MIHPRLEIAKTQLSTQPIPDVLMASWGWTLCLAVLIWDANSGGQGCRPAPLG
jgi:hypothetical protein